MNGKILGTILGVVGVLLWFMPLAHVNNFFAVWFFVLFLIVAFWVVRILMVSSLPSIEEYKQGNPKAVDRHGNVRCVHCNSNNIYLWWLFGPQVGFGPKKHICRKCGSTLWKS